ncbi:MAG: hypothetical protein AAGI66_09985 [Cyanobacteria bacterium P01_H01_bin.74]
MTFLYGYAPQNVPAYQLAASSGMNTAASSNSFNNNSISSGFSNPSTLPTAPLQGDAFNAVGQISQLLMTVMNLILQIDNGSGASNANGALDNSTVQDSNPSKSGRMKGNRKKKNNRTGASNTSSNNNTGRSNGNADNTLRATEANIATGDWKRTTVDGQVVYLYDAAGSSYKNVSNSKLEFDLNADSSGTYNIDLFGGRVKSAMNSDERSREDTGNDVYISVIDKNTGREVLSPTKMFVFLGHTDQEIRQGTKFDKNHVKSRAQVSLRAGGDYKVVVHGRSDGFAFSHLDFDKA